jgi:DNA/RNA-binding domain of Phe-tRNA-synthetase-like protein
MGNLQNRQVSAEFEEYKAAACRKILAGLSPEAIRDDSTLRGFRDLHTRFGFSNRSFPAASESLLEYLLKYQRLPQVNLLVDIYNLVSVETRLALGAHDLSAVSGNVRLGLTTGVENFWPLGAPEAKLARAGAYAYMDDDQDVLCFLEVKQVQKSRVTLETGECLFILQGNQSTPSEMLRGATEYLLDLIKKFCGGDERILYPPDWQAAP